VGVNASAELAIVNATLLSAGIDATQVDAVLAVLQDGTETDCNTSGWATERAIFIIVIAILAIFLFAEFYRRSLATIEADRMAAREAALKATGVTTSRGVDDDVDYGGGGGDWKSTYDPLHAQ
jgi:hypothetical protein